MGIQAVYFPNTTAGNSDGIYFDEAPCLFEGGDKVSFGFRCYRTHSPTTGNDSRLIGLADGVNENEHSLMCSQISTTGFRVRIRAGATTSTHVTATGVFLQDTYYDWVATYDGATLRLYRNGVELNSGDFPATLSGTLGRDAGMRLGIGNNGVSENRPFGGFLADPWIDWHTWEPRRVAAYHHGEDLANLVVAPELWSRLDDWPDGSTSKGIPNKAARSPLGRGVAQGQIEGGIMPGINRRDFVQVLFLDFPVLAAAGGLSLIEIIGETAQGAEGRASPRGLARLLAETAQAGEDPIPARALARAQAEAAETAEGVIDSLAAIIVRAVAETLQAVESLARTLGLTRARADSATTAEATARARSLVRPVAERLDNSVGRLGSRVLTRLADELSEGLELRRRALLLTRAVGETANATEAVAQLKNFVEDAKMAIRLVGHVVLATPLAALRRTVISLTGKIDN